jgi:hypothetical protein
MKLTDLVLKSYVNGTIGELDKKCAADAAACENVAITNEQEEVLAYVLRDGAITDREKAMLSFLPASVVNGIAGDDGKRPARMKAEALVKKLAAAKPHDILEIAAELPALDPVTRATVEPEVRKVQAKMEKESAAIEVRNERLARQREALSLRIGEAREKYEEMKNDGYERIDNLNISENGVVYRNMVADHERRMATYFAAHVQPLLDQYDRLEKEQIAPESTLNTMLSAITMLHFYLDQKAADSPRVSRAVLRMMSIDELEQEVRAKHGPAALMTMIERFPGEEKTTALCQEAIRQLKDAKDPDALVKNKDVLRILDYIGNFRSRLEPVVNDVPEVLLPALLAAHPEENVSDLIIGRIVKAALGTEWKIKAFAAAGEKADPVTLDRIVAAWKRLHWVDDSTSPRLNRRFEIDRRLRYDVREARYDRLNHYWTTRRNTEFYAECLAGKWGAGCEENPGSFSLTSQQRQQIRTAMEQGASELFLSPDGTITWK